MGVLPPSACLVPNRDPYHNYSPASTPETLDLLFRPYVELLQVSTAAL